MKKDYIWIGIGCVILGVFISFQMKFVQGTYLNGTTPTQKTTEILNELSAVKSEKEELLSQIETLESQLGDIQGSAANENAVIKGLTEELNRFKNFAGMTKVQGQGILVTIDNPPQDSSYGVDLNINYDYKLILELINELNSAGAEAISINDQRMVNNTEVRFASSQINVNTVPLTAPFTIKAIGNSRTLQGALNQRFGIVSTIRAMGYYIEVKEVDNLELPAFNGSIKFYYATPVK
ncbi:DUF881 domain-containing protein [Fusibacter paucivorans]|uniref:DUF881 domain-containing protein n=1 Tax=Fusibacter paucivorans TaxID=76009 RepID=A0ABS5PT66_9FIRM|nr:DUF881 domain-containing protein [Fusibacter paucivorans]